MNNYNIIKILKILHLKLEELKLTINIGTENAVATACLTSTISGIIGINIPRIVSTNDIVNNNIYYKVNPIYNRNILVINLTEAIISLRIINILPLIVTTQT